MSSVDKEIPIDAVITWVDGKDEAHQKKMLPFVDNNELISSKSFRTKLDQVEEIKYTVNSILQYAPFIRNVFIVTDNQVPSFLKNKRKDEYKNVFIVDHLAIFKEDKKFLPIFNCRPIETKLYAIPNLSEHFIYFNDDMFLLKHVKVTDFFVNGEPVIRGKWLNFKENLFIKRFSSNKKKNKASHIKAQENSAKIVGFKKYYKFHHSPYPLRKSTFANFFKNNKEIEINNIKFKFRNPEQYTPQGLANHIEIKNKTCVLKRDYQLVYFRNYQKPFLWLKYKLNFITATKSKLFLNMQSLDQCPEYKLQYIFQWLNKKYLN